LNEADKVDPYHSVMSTQRHGNAAGAGVTAKGQLRPGGPVSMVRVGFDARFEDVARQVWIGRWHLPPGVQHRQPVLNYPAVNIAIEADRAAAYLPVRGLAEKILAGDGWVAGVMLRPGAGVLFVPGDHGELLGTEAPIREANELVRRVRGAMSGGEVADAEVATSFEDWLDPFIDRVDDEVRLVNAICDTAERDTDLRTSRDLAERFGLSERSLQRLLRRRVGMGPKWLLQRRRLHAAAARIRECPDDSFADIAADLQYSDQAHFTRDFASVVGCAPSAYRRSLNSPMPRRADWQPCRS